PIPSSLVCRNLLYADAFFLFRLLRDWIRQVWLREHLWRLLFALPIHFQKDASSSVVFLPRDIRVSFGSSSVGHPPAFVHKPDAAFSPSDQTEQVHYSTSQTQ